MSKQIQERLNELITRVPALMVQLQATGLF